MDFSKLIFQKSSTDQQGVGPVGQFRVHEFLVIKQIILLHIYFLKKTALCGSKCLMCIVLIEIAHWTTYIE